MVDGTAGGKLLVANAVEGNTSLGCLNIEANLEDQTGARLPQPCSGCGGGIADDVECRCGHQKLAPVLECCSQ